MIFVGVGHGEDIPYLFYVPFSRIPINNVDVQTTINRYVRLVTNFAKYGYVLAFRSNT